MLVWQVAFEPWTVHHGSVRRQHLIRAKSRWNARDHCQHEIPQHGDLPEVRDANETHAVDEQGHSDHHDNTTLALFPTACRHSLPTRENAIMISATKSASAGDPPRTPSKTYWFVMSPSTTPQLSTLFTPSSHHSFTRKMKKAPPARLQPQSRQSIARRLPNRGSNTETKVHPHDVVRYT